MVLNYFTAFVTPTRQITPLLRLCVTVIPRQEVIGFIFAAVVTILYDY